MTFLGCPRNSKAIISAFFVSSGSGELDIAQPTGFLENKSITTAKYDQRFPDKI